MEEQIGSVEQYMKNCRLCPRECGADRTRGRAGRCGVGSGILIARAALHFWEEPCISGNAGSGAVFFTGCSLGCIYCQNAPISGVGHEMLGREVTITQLGDIFLRLQDKQHASNINLVTASHYIPQTAAALLYAKRKGLRIPVVYNSSGYEKADSLRMLEGLVDVYLPDFKYIDPELAFQYSRARDYPDRVREALAEMFRQTGPVRFSDGMVTRGVIVRHLLLPGHVKDAKAIVKELHDTYADAVCISLMNQYTPMEALRNDPLLGRKVTAREYRRLIDYAIETGVENGFIQEGATAEESFIPAWNEEGVISSEENEELCRAGKSVQR